MLRLALILTIVAGLAALGVGQMVVKPKIEKLTEDLATSETGRTSAEQAKATAESNAKKAVEAEQKAAQALAEAVTRIETTGKDLQVQRKRATDLDAQVAKLTVERNEAQQELSAWRAVGIPVDQIKDQRAQLLTTRRQLDQQIEENRVFDRKNKVIESELKRYRGEVADVALPPGLRGKVLAVDPKFDFVILNIGTKQGALENGKLMINRDGRLVGKVQLTRVDESRSIANVLPEWKQSDVLEGDDVLY